MIELKSGHYYRDKDGDILMFLNLIECSAELANFKLIEFCYPNGILRLGETYRWSIPALKLRPMPYYNSPLYQALNGEQQ